MVIAAKDYEIILKDSCEIRGPNGTCSWVLCDYPNTTAFSFIHKCRSFRRYDKMVIYPPINIETYLALVAKNLIECAKLRAARIKNDFIRTYRTEYLAIVQKINLKDQTFQVNASIIAHENFSELISEFKREERPLTSQLMASKLWSP